MDNINYIDMPVSEFTAALASSSPAPGGGGASALAAALGASLGCMVGELTVGKPKYAANEPRRACANSSPRRSPCARGC